MALPVGVSNHHTAWVTALGRDAHPVRYAVDGSRLVCFGDGFLADVPDHARVTVSIHEIAGSGGHLLSSFGASLRRLTPTEVDMNALGELLDHVGLAARSTRSKRSWRSSERRDGSWSSFRSVVAKLHFSRLDSTNVTDRKATDPEVSN